MVTTDIILDRLEQSSMFYMSLGSKELFHSNFLYWLSIVDRDAFLSELHGLAKVEKFWWEDSYPQDNIEVRRESRNFDLSVYVKTYTEKNKKGEIRKVETWIPVLVLENKMKSMPRHDQLQEYTAKAFNEWRQKKPNNQLATLWEEQPISFILLSLFTPEDFPTNCTYTHKYGKGKKTIHVEATWEKNSYSDLHRFLSILRIGEANSFNQKILSDYCTYIKALHDLTLNDWQINENDYFVEKIYPWAIEGYTGDRQVQLRIDDIRQKVHYAQLKNLLEKALLNNGIQVAEAPIKKNSPDGLYCGTNFAHNIGILEIAVKHGEELLFIQLQGNSYAHAFSLADNKDAATILLERKDDMEPLFEFEVINNNSKSKERTTTKYPALLQTQVLYPQGINTQAIKNGRKLECFKYFGQSFIYQNVLIPKDITIRQVIQAMVEDAKKCQTCLGFASP